MNVRELMSSEPHYCAPEHNLADAARMMWDFDCGALPVCTGDGAPHVVGMITDRDICMSALFQDKTLKELPVREAMNDDAQTCRPDASPAEVERIMREKKIRRIPVTEADGTLIGVVSLADLAHKAKEQQGIVDLEINDSEVTDTLAAVSQP